MKICECAERDCLLIFTVFKYLGMILDGNLHWGYPLINGNSKWHCECGLMTFSGFFSAVSFLLAMSTPHTEAIKWKFWHSIFEGHEILKFTDQNTFLERFTWQVDEIIDQLHLTKSIPNSSVSFIQCQKTFSILRRKVSKSKSVLKI